MTVALKLVEVKGKCTDCDSKKVLKEDFNGLNIACDLSLLLHFAYRSIDLENPIQLAKQLGPGMRGQVPLSEISKTSRPSCRQEIVNIGCNSLQQAGSHEFPWSGCRIMLSWKKQWATLSKVKPYWCNIVSNIESGVDAGVNRRGEVGPLAKEKSQLEMLARAPQSGL